MAKYKDYSYEQKTLVPVSFADQVLPGTLEYTLSKVIDEMDLSIFHERIKNDTTGAPAYDPAILLKIILFAYSKGIISSRRIEQLARDNVICMALSADSHPHFTTIAHFISSMEKEIVPLFTKILSICYTSNVIGKNMFAIDGCKISSNCSKEWSGRKKDLLKKAHKIEDSIEFLLTKHKQADKSTYTKNQEEAEKESIEKLRVKAKKITDWLDENDDKLGAQGKSVQSNIIDNESAKMATSHGVIQGYTGIAAVDDQHQVIVWGEAFGDSAESQHFPEILEGVKKNFSEIGASKDIFDEAVVTADSGFHNEANMELIMRNNVTAFVADNQFRKRDVRFESAKQHQKQVANWKPLRKKKYFSADEFEFDKPSGNLICPAGHSMILRCRNFRTQKIEGVGYIGKRENCQTCQLRKSCIRNETTPARQVVKNTKRIGKISYTEKMKKVFDTSEARSIYSKRMGAVEPVFGNIRSTLGLDQFSLRSKKKVNIQWLLYCIVHNIGKIHRYAQV